MAAQLTVEFEQIVKLVEQLPQAQKNQLFLQLLEQAKTRGLTTDERKLLLQSMVVDAGAVLPGYSDRREDWYGDAGK